MRKIVSILLLFLFLFSLSGCNKDKGSLLTSDSLSEVNSYLLEDYNSIMGGLGLNCTNLNGFRAVGNYNDKSESDYIADYMRDIGLRNVEQIPIEFDGWNVSDINMVYDCECQGGGSYSIYGLGVHPTTFKFTGDRVFAVYVGSLLKEVDYDISGKGVILSSFENLNLEVRKAEELGASFVIYPYTKNQGFGVDITKCSNSKIPVFVISSIHYNLMTKDIEKGSSVGMTIEGESSIKENITSDFIVGEIVGKNKNEYVYVTANRDSITSGYFSSRYSVAELLTLAKSLVEDGYKPKYTIRFLVTTGQEFGDLDLAELNVGIRRYLETINLKSVKYCINLEGGKPFSDTAITEVQFSDSIINSGVYNDIEKYNADVKENNDSFITMLNPISNGYNTEGLVWDELGVSTIIQAEPVISTYYMIENNSGDGSSQIVDEDTALYIFGYMKDILKLVAK